VGEQAHKLPEEKSVEDTEPLQSISFFRRKKKILVAVGILLFLVIASIVAIVAFREQTGRLPGVLEKFNPAPLSKAEQEGKEYAHGTCSGSQIKKLTHVPIDAADITNILPYGGVVGAHVMPISHGYIWPGKQHDPRDKYNVYAMADSTLLGISSRSVNVDSGQPKQAEFQLQFSISCVEFYYYDLITSLTPDLQKYLDEHPSQSQFGNSVTVNIPIKAGQLLGKIGGQTLDWAVWDFNKTLSGYVIPEHYKGDYPRIHLVSPFDYMSDEVKQALLPKLARGVPPVEGKVDYDIDGKLIGGWFLEGSGGYSGLDQGNGRYWEGHLAIIPDYHDPTFMGISIGAYTPGKEAQFSIARDAPDPKTIGVESGLVKYDLYQGDHTLSDGGMWDRFTPVKDLVGKTNGPSQGCALFQLVEARKLKVEFTPGHPCMQTTLFTSSAKSYAR
jgi:hypothetical protein